MVTSRSAAASSSTIRPAMARLSRQGGQSCEVSTSTAICGRARSRMFMEAGSKDGLYGIGFWAKNIGYNDQSYFLTCRRPASTISTSAGIRPRTLQHQRPDPYNGVGTNSLTIPNSVSNAVCGTAATGPRPSMRQTANRLSTRMRTRPIRHPAGYAVGGLSLDADRRLGHQVDYSHMRRTGTQVRASCSTNDGGRLCRGPEAGQRYYAEFRRERRICRHLLLGPEVQRQVGLCGVGLSGDDSFDVQNLFRNDATCSVNTGSVPRAVGPSLVRQPRPLYAVRPHGWLCGPTTTRMRSPARWAPDCLGKSRYMGT